MAVPRNANYTVYTGVEYDGATETINSQTVVGLAADPSGNLLLCRGATSPTASGAGYARGCIFIITGLTSTPCILVNAGSATSCNFTGVSQL